MQALSRNDQSYPRYAVSQFLFTLFLMQLIFVLFSDTVTICSASFLHSEVEPVRLAFLHIILGFYVTKLTMRKRGQAKIPGLWGAKIRQNQLIFYPPEVLMSAASCNPATKTLTFLCCTSNLIEFFSFPLLGTCFKRSFLPRRCYFSFTCALRFSIIHPLLSKQISSGPMPQTQI